VGEKTPGHRRERHQKREGLLSAGHSASASDSAICARMVSGGEEKEGERKGGQSACSPRKGLFTFAKGKREDCEPPSDSQRIEGILKIRGGKEKELSSCGRNEEGGCSPPARRVVCLGHLAWEGIVAEKERLFVSTRKAIYRLYKGKNAATKRTLGKGKKVSWEREVEFSSYSTRRLGEKKGGVDTKYAVFFAGMRIISLNNNHRGEGGGDRVIREGKKKVIFRESQKEGVRPGSCPRGRG